MIENIYSDDTKEYTKTNLMFRIPKNVRQIGTAESGKKIYVEDYVMTYIRQLAMSNFHRYKIAVLLGKFIKNKGTSHIFIYGAVEAGKADFDLDEVFTNEAWNDIYNSVKTFFDDVEIVGWYLSKPGIMLDSNDKIIRTHLNNFAGQDKTLLLYDSIEKEENFYLYEKNELIKQSGYYIYYEKNEEMQNYMVEGKKNTGIEPDYEDRTMKEIRRIISEKKETKFEHTANRLSPALYGAGTVLAAAVLVLGASNIKNIGKVKDTDEVVSTVSDYVVGNEKTNMEDENKKAAEQETQRQTGVTQVNTVKGELTEITDETKNVDTETQKTQKKSEQKSKTDNNSNAANKVQKQAKNTVPAKKTKSPNYYIIKEGDTLAKISLKYYSTIKYIDKIKNVNSIENENKIIVGDKIILP